MRFEPDEIARNHSLFDYHLYDLPVYSFYSEG